MKNYPQTTSQNTAYDFPTISLVHKAKTKTDENQCAGDSGELISIQGYPDGQSFGDLSTNKIVYSQARPPSAGAGNSSLFRFPLISGHN